MNLPTIAISVQQPWAWFIVNGVKDVENRTWPVPSKYIGPVLIHAGKSPKFSMAEASDIIQQLRERHGKPESMTCFKLGRETGGIVGMARIVGCTKGHRSIWANTEPGTWHWEIADAKPLPFMPFKGVLGFFSVEYPGQINGQGRLL